MLQKYRGFLNLVRILFKDRTPCERSKPYIGERSEPYMLCILIYNKARYVRQYKARLARPYRARIARNTKLASLTSIKNINIRLSTPFKSICKNQPKSKGSTVIYKLASRSLCANIAFKRKETITCGVPVSLFANCRKFCNFCWDRCALSRNF